MAKKTITLTNWEGGIAGQEKRGIAGSARFIKNLTPHEDDSYLTLTPKASKVSGSTVTGLVKWAVDGSPWDTNRYFYADNGVIYKETSGGTWSVYQTVVTSNNSNPAGQGMAVYDNSLWWATSRFIGLAMDLRSGSPIIIDEASNQDIISTTGNLDQSASPSGNTYALSTSISEAAANKKEFTPTKDPIRFIKVYASAKGTGNWTLTVHDYQDNEVASETIANGSLANASYNSFFFDTLGRITANNTYHFHVTSTVADGTVRSGSANDLSTVDYTEHYADLVDDSDFHPMVEFLNSLVIGNERYLAVWDGATYDPNRLTFGPQYKVRALTKIDEFLVIGCWRGSNVDDEDLGRLYFWDGISTTFNFFKDVPMGVVNALVSSKNKLTAVYGSSGKIYMGVEEFLQIAEPPKLSRGKKIEVFPGAVTNWQGLTAIGIGANTDDSSGVEQGVYILGSQDGDHPEVLTLGYTISTGTTQGTGLEIGCVAAFGADMYIGWKDGATYGVDKVSKTDNPNTSGIWESLILDNGNPKKEKMIEKIIVTFEPLESGESITPKYRIDRAANFTNGTTQSTVDATSAEILLDARYKEFEWGFAVGTSTTYPKITSTSALLDDLSEERNE